MKKTISIIAAIAMLVSLVASFGCVSASAAQGNVSLYSIEEISAKYGMESYAINVQTNDDCANQKVYVHYKYGDTWQDVEATYYTTIENGTKIWRAFLYTYELEYAIRYEADGVTIWDNNNGQNYTDVDVIGNTNVCVNTQWSYYLSNHAYIGATVKNLAYEKNVFVRYTDNNWETYTDVPMSYKETLANGTENWTVDFDTETTGEGFEYAIGYTVNGQTYWANNFGANFNSYYCVHH